MGLTVIGVTIAGGALVTMLAFGLGVQQAIEEPFRQLDLTSRIEVRMPNDESSRRRGRPQRETAVPKPLDTAESKEPPPLGRAAITRFEAIRGVRLVYPKIRVEHVKLRFDDREASTTVLGVHPRIREFAFVEEALIAGDFPSEPRSSQFVLGVGLTEQLGFEDPESALGASVRLISRGLVPADDGTLQWTQTDLELTIAGVIKGLGFGSRMGRNTALVPIETAESLPGARFREVVQQFEGKTPPDEDAYREIIVRVQSVTWLGPVEKRIQELGYETENMLTQIDTIGKTFIVFDSLLALIGAVALLVASLGIVNTQLMSVLERTKEIAIYKAIGASNGDVRTIFLAEAAIVGLLGGVGGVLLSLATAKVLGIAVNAYVRTQGIDDGLRLFAFPWWLFVAALGFTLTISVMSGLYPAGRAAKVDPIHALRGE